MRPGGSGVSPTNDGCRARLARERNAAVLAAVVLAALGLEGEAAETSLAFEHGRHSTQLESAEQAAIDCNGCHSLDKRSRPRRIGHDKCFGACHGAAPANRSAAERARTTPYPIEPARRAVCSSCHSPDALDRIATGSRETLAPAPPRRPDLVVSAPLPHPAHTGVAGDCLSCHTEAAKTRTPASHDGCATCHRTASKPSMNQCAGCHSERPAGGLRPYSTRDTFNHESHAPRIGKTDDRCRACHASDSVDPVLWPTKPACAGCHDGVAAFSMVQAACRRCHSPPETPVPRRRAKRVRFSHETHEGLDRKLACADCHRLDPAGEPRAPESEHAPCSDSGCHADDFASPKPAVCAACHIGTEPWLELYASVSPPPGTEYGSLYSHKAHRGGDKPRHTRDCTDCHTRDTATRQRRLPRSHSACSGEACHLTDHGATPALTACKSCHVGNLVNEREARQIARAWNVRKKFSHRSHLTEPDEARAAVSCESCHRGLAESDTIFDVPAPRKTECARCHNGKSAFKLTGHGCSRCHDS